VLCSSGITAITTCRIEGQSYTVALDSCSSIIAVRGEDASSIRSVQIKNQKYNGSYLIWRRGLTTGGYSYEVIKCIVPR